MEKSSLSKYDSSPCNDHGWVNFPSASLSSLTSVGEPVSYRSSSNDSSAIDRAPGGVSLRYTDNEDYQDKGKGKDVGSAIEHYHNKGNSVTPAGRDHYIMGQHDLDNWDPKSMFSCERTPAVQYGAANALSTGLPHRPVDFSSREDMYRVGSLTIPNTMQPVGLYAFTTQQDNTARLREGIDNVFVPSRNMQAPLALRTHPILPPVALPQGVDDMQDYERPSNIRTWRGMQPPIGTPSSLHSGELLHDNVSQLGRPSEVRLPPWHVSHDPLPQFPTPQVSGLRKLSPVQPLDHARIAIRDVQNQSTTANNQLAHAAGARKRTVDELVTLINSGTWDLSGGENDSPTRAPKRTRPGRTIASVFDRQSTRGDQRHSEHNRHNGRYDTPAHVLAQRERDARNLAAIKQRVPPPPWFPAVLHNNLTPPIQDLLRDMPFCDPTAGCTVPEYGVIRITEPPYNVTKAEVLNLLGRHAQIKAQPYGTSWYGIHIMIDRNTGKTKDVFVEVSCQLEAATIAEQFSRRESEGRNLTLGRRQAHVLYSTMEELMNAIFPFAKYITWKGSKPQLNDHRPSYYLGEQAASFDGFIGQDETALMLKWLQEPTRSPFLSRGPNRLYENVITLLHKYPAHAPGFIYLKDRRRLFEIASQGVNSLATILREEKPPPEARLDNDLLRELVVAALSFPLFSDGQKAAIVSDLGRDQYYPLIHKHDLPVRLGGTHELASRWPFLALVRDPRVDDNFVQYYCKLISGQTTRTMAGLTHGEISALAAAGLDQGMVEPFVALRIDYGVNDDGYDHLGLLTIVECVALEYKALHQILKKALGHDEPVVYG